MDEVLVCSSDDAMTTAVCGMQVGDLSKPLVEINNIVDKAKGDIENLSNRPYVSPWRYKCMILSFRSREYVPTMVA